MKEATQVSRHVKNSNDKFATPTRANIAALFVNWRMWNILQTSQQAHYKNSWPHTTSTKRSGFLCLPTCNILCRRGRVTCKRHSCTHMRCSSAFVERLLCTSFARIIHPMHVNMVLSKHPKSSELGSSTGSDACSKPRGCIQAEAMGWMILLYSVMHRKGLGRCNMAPFPLKQKHALPSECVLLKSTIYLIYIYIYIYLGCLLTTKMATKPKK